jgi:hypothetical protein
MVSSSRATTTTINQDLADYPVVQKGCRGVLPSFRMWIAFVSSSHAPKSGTPRITPADMASNHVNLYLEYTVSIGSKAGWMLSFLAASRRAAYV